MARHLSDVTFPGGDGGLERGVAGEEDEQAPGNDAGHVQERPTQLGFVLARLAVGVAAVERLAAHAAAHHAAPHLSSTGREKM